MKEGLVTIKANHDGPLGETVLKWRFDEADNDGFIVVSDTLGKSPIPPRTFFPITELAAELFLEQYTDHLLQALETTDVEFVTEEGINLLKPAFLPPSFKEDDEMESLVEMQSVLRTIWLRFQRENDLMEHHIADAKSADVLIDFLSMVSLERRLLIGDLEKR
jgi:hypothetical protein